MISTARFGWDGQRWWMPMLEGESCEVGSWFLVKVLRVRGLVFCFGFRWGGGGGMPCLEGVLG
jgi:hypothetical protein